MSGRVKIFALLPDELRHILIILVMTASVLNVFTFAGGGSAIASPAECIWSAAALSVLYISIRYVFERFAGRKGSAAAVSVSAVLIAFLLRNIRIGAVDPVSYSGLNADIEGHTVPLPGIYAGVFVAAVYLVWLCLKLWEDRLYPNAVLCLMSDAVLIYSYFTNGSNILNDFTGKVIYASCVVLTAYYILLITGSVYGKRASVLSDRSVNVTNEDHEGTEYPFAYFVLLFIVLLIIPVRNDPINWKPFVDAGRRVVDTTIDIAESATYYISDLGKDYGYRTGYSSFAQRADSVQFSDRTELKLKTMDNTPIRFTSKETGKDMIRKRVIYLKGGSTADPEQMLDLLYSFYLKGVNKDEASLFARIASLDITYAYLKTRDEIAPSNLIRLNDERGNPVDGNSKKTHRKGYTIHADYLDLDYGSPYLERLAASGRSYIPHVQTNTGDNISPKDNIYNNGSVYEDNTGSLKPDYREFTSYVYQTFGIRLDRIADEAKYNAWSPGESQYGSSGSAGENLDTGGAPERLRSLATEITSGCENDYDKCLAIQTYLRKYKYTTKTDAPAFSGNGREPDTGSAEGMSLIADDFLFESGRGYCVHFASAMVMMLRLNGIPAKFTTGYRYAFPFDKQDVYEVKAGNAHAWPEAYISGLGWVGFEPTTVMSTAADRTWHKQPAGTQNAAYDDGYSANHGNIPDPYANWKETGNVYDKQDPNDNAVTGDDHERNQRILLETAKIAMVTVSAVILMILLMISGSWIYKSVRYKMADPNTRIILDVDDIVKLIRTSTDCNFEERGILSDYEPYIPEIYKDRVKEAFAIYLRIKYRGDGEMGDEMIDDEVWEKVRELRMSMSRGTRGRF